MYKLILFSVGSEDFAVPIQTVQEVIELRKFTKVPSYPPTIEGVTNLRGDIIPIINGRKRFNMSGADVEQGEDESEVASQILIINTGKTFLGLVVDFVSDVIEIPPEHIEKSPVEMQENKLITGIGKFGEKLLIMIDPEFLLSKEEFELVRG